MRWAATAGGQYARVPSPAAAWGHAAVRFRPLEMRWAATAAPAVGRLFRRPLAVFVDDVIGWNP